LRGCLQRLRSDCGGGGDGGERYALAVGTLRGVVERALAAVTAAGAGGGGGAGRSGQLQRYRQLRPANSAFAARTVGSPAAVEFLRAAGFARQEQPVPTAGASNAATRGDDALLSLPLADAQVDVAALWLAREVATDELTAGAADPQRDDGARAAGPPPLREQSAEEGRVRAA
jgi:hypothetical protein